MTNKPRIIITTDMEVDDMNSLIHMSLFFDCFDIAGIVYTASQYHFNGDGIHTLGEVTPHYRCEGEEVYQTNTGYPHPDPNAKFLKSYRPFPEGWIESFIKNEYTSVYANLSQHSSYPTPESLLRVVRYGNIAFEGDVRFETEGSKLITEAILDDDPRILYLLSWGGSNTIVRALLTIIEDYQNTLEWNAIYQKIVHKVRILGIFNGVGQDYAFQDHIKEIIPDIKVLVPEFLYGTYFSSITAPSSYRYMFGPQWLKENIKFHHGPLLGKYYLFGDGTYYEGEPDRYQYGLHPTIDWGYDAIPAVTFEPYTFLSEGDSITYVCLIDVGLRGLENGRYGTLEGRLYLDGDKVESGYDYVDGKDKGTDRFLKGYQEEWAARADWCVKSFEECTHPPVVMMKEAVIDAKASETIDLVAQVKDVDGNGLLYRWFYYREGSTYSGDVIELNVWDSLSLDTKFLVPSDAQKGDEFNFILEVRTISEHPITRYGQIIVQVN